MNEPSSPYNVFLSHDAKDKAVVRILSLFASTEERAEGDVFPAPKILLQCISQHGNANEIIGRFGGADQLRDFVKQLQSLLYAA